MGNEQQHFKIVGVTAHIITEQHHKEDSYKQTFQIFDELGDGVDKAVDVAAINEHTRRRYDGTADVIFRSDDAEMLTKLLKAGVDNDLIEKNVGNLLQQVAVKMPNYVKQVNFRANYDKQENLRSLTLSLPYPKSKPVEMKMSGGLIPDDVVKQMEQTIAESGCRNIAALVKNVDALYLTFNSHQMHDNLFGYQFDLKHREIEAESKGERSTEWCGIRNQCLTEEKNNPLYKGIDRYGTIGQNGEMSFHYPADTLNQDLFIHKVFGNEVSSPTFMALTLDKDGKFQDITCWDDKPHTADLAKIQSAYPLITADRIIEQAVNNSLQFEYGYYIGENKELGIMESKCTARVSVIEDGNGGKKTKDLQSYIDELHKRMLMFGISEAYGQYIDNMGGSPKVKEVADEEKAEGDIYSYFGVGTMERSKEEQAADKEVSLAFYGINNDTIWLFSEKKSVGDVLRDIAVDKLLAHIKEMQANGQEIEGTPEALMLSFVANEKLMQEMDKIHINDEIMKNLPAIHYDESKTAFAYALEMYGEKPLAKDEMQAILDAGKIPTMEKRTPPPPPMVEKKTFSLPSVNNPKGGTVSKAGKKPAGKKETASPSPVSDAPEKPDADAKNDVSEDITDTL